MQCNKVACIWLEGNCILQWNRHKTNSYRTHLSLLFSVHTSDIVPWSGISFVLRHKYDALRRKTSSLLATSWSLVMYLLFIWGNYFFALNHRNFLKQSHNRFVVMANTQLKDTTSRWTDTIIQKTQLYSLPSSRMPIIPSIHISTNDVFASLGAHIYRLFPYKSFLHPSLSDANNFSVRFEGHVVTKGMPSK